MQRRDGGWRRREQERRLTRARAETINKRYKAAEEPAGDAVEQCTKARKAPPLNTRG